MQRNSSRSLFHRFPEISSSLVEDRCILVFSKKGYPRRSQKESSRHQRKEKRPSRRNLTRKFSMFRSTIYDFSPPIPHLIMSVNPLQDLQQRTVFSIYPASSGILFAQFSACPEHPQRKRDGSHARNLSRLAQEEKRKTEAQLWVRGAVGNGESRGGILRRSVYHVAGLTKHSRLR